MNPSIIKKAKRLFFKMIIDYGSDPYLLKSHILEVERWAIYVLKKYPKADQKVVLLSVWLHDIGHYPVQNKVDHAVRGIKRAKKFLNSEKYAKEKIDIVLHCIRAHRCKDVLPKTLEAKIIAFIDSASHMTDSMYFDIAKKDKAQRKEFKVYSKIERDWRDMSLFPEFKHELVGLYKLWKLLLREYEKFNLD